MLQRRRCSRKVVNNSFPLSSFRRKPCLILTNVLETELGKAYMERIKHHALGNRGQLSFTRRESGRCREEPKVCREMRSTQRETRNDKNKSVTPKSNQKTISSPAQRQKDSVQRKVLHFSNMFFCFLAESRIFPINMELQQLVSSA